MQLAAEIEGSNAGVLQRNTTDLVSSGTAVDHGTLDNTLDEGNT